jgi:hypothetical protein
MNIMLETIKKLGYQAHLNTSFSPERRAEQEQQYFQENLDNLTEKIKKILPENQAEIEIMTEQLFRKTCQYLRVKSGCISTMITGGSNFPVRKAERANQRERAASEAFSDFLNNYIKKLEKKYGINQPDIIKSGAEDAVEKLKEKIARLEKHQETMKEVNAIIRKTKDEEQLRSKLAAFGLTDKMIESVLTPFCGSIGFQSFCLTNNNAEIRRLKQRLEHEEKAKNTATKKHEGRGGVEIEDNAAENRVRLYFPGKPEKEVIEQLKKNGFRWAPSLGCWQGYRNNRSVYFARTFLDEAKQK